MLWSTIILPYLCFCAPWKSSRTSMLFPPCSVGPNEKVIRWLPPLFPSRCLTSHFSISRSLKRSQVHQILNESSRPLSSFLFSPCCILEWRKSLELCRCFLTGSPHTWSIFWSFLVLVDGSKKWSSEYVDIYRFVFQFLKVVFWKDFRIVPFLEQLNDSFWWFFKLTQQSIWHQSYIEYRLKNGRILVTKCFMYLGLGAESMIADIVSTMLSLSSRGKRSSLSVIIKSNYFASWRRLNCS